MRLIFTFIWILLCFVQAQAASNPYVLGGQGAAAGCSPTAHVTQDSGGQDADTESYSIGQTFTRADTDIYSVTIYTYGTNTGSMTMRLKYNSTDLSAGYSEATQSCSAASACEFVFNLTACQLVHTHLGSQKLQAIHI